MRKLLLAAFFSITLISISGKSEAQVLINYWNFNSFTSTVGDTFGSAYDPIPVFKASYSVIDTNKAVFTYVPQSGISTKSADSAWVDVNAGTTVNAQQGAAAGNALRIRNPTDGMEMRFYIPTNNFNNISFTYALETSSLTSGDSIQLFDYSVDSGNTWNTSAITVNGVNVDTLKVAQSAYNGQFALVTIGFGSDTNVNNNPKLVLRIKFKRANAGTSGNNRFDNVAVTGNYLASSIVVSTPPLGDTLYVGNPDTIIYQTSGLIAPVRTVNLSTDSGNTWTELGLSSRDTFVWVVPNRASSNCFIEVIDTVNQITGKSPRFVIHVQKIVVSAPPAGDTLLVGQTDSVEYQTFGLISNFRAINLSTDSGKTWTEEGISSKDTFAWVVPNDTSSNCFIEVVDQNGITGKSGKLVVLYSKPAPAPPPPPPAWLIHYWNFSTFSTTGDTVPNVPRLKAFYSAIDTNKATIIDTLVPGTSKSYVSFVDNTPGDSCNALLGDLTTNALRVRNPSDSMQLLIFMPSTGYKNLSLVFGLESSSTGSGQSIEYYAYSVDGGNTWKTSGLTVNGTAVDTLNLLTYKSNGATIYEKGGPPGTGYGLMSIGINDTSANNNPNLVFRVEFKAQNTGTSGNNRFEHVALEGTSTKIVTPPVPDSIKVSAPIAGDTLLSRTHQNITYTVTSSTSYTRYIQYSTNGGTTWINIDTALNTLTYNWTVPATASSNALIRVIDTTGVIGLSGKFVILVPGTVASVTLTTPNVTEGTTTNIMWSASGYLGNTLNIDVAYDGVTWNSIVAGYPVANTSYAWTAPMSQFSGVLIRVTFASGSTGISAPFDIVAPASVSDASNVPANIELWPNPFQTQTTLQYNLSSSEDVSLSVHDLLGREIENIQEGTQTAGVHQITFDGSHEPAGIYMYELTIGNIRNRGELVIVH